MADSNPNKEEQNDTDELESIDYSYGDDAISLKNESEDKETEENNKSDEDMQGYDTRSEVNSSISYESDKDSEDAVSNKSFDIKRKRRDVTSFHGSSSHTQDSRKKYNAVSPLKENSGEYISKLNYLFRDARFFIIKSSNAENIALSKAKGVWATLPQNQVKLTEAFKNSENVILIFSAKESGKFSGFARLATGIDKNISPVQWVVPSELTANLLRGTFHIDWICRKDLPFNFTTNLYNPWNCNKPVKIARDGQEVEPRIGEKLCRLFPEDEGIDITPILRKSRDAARNRISRSSIESTNKSLYTAKYRAKLFGDKNMKDHKLLVNRIRDADRAMRKLKNRNNVITTKHFITNTKELPLRNRIVTSVESYVKRYGHSFRPPFPVPIPFLPMHPSSELFPSHFPHLPFPPPPSHLPRYYENPSFSQMSKLVPSSSRKHLYDRNVEEFLNKTKIKYHTKSKEIRLKKINTDERYKYRGKR